nr:hypothetical protein [uncultured Sphingomonas sp.]
MLAKILGAIAGEKMANKNDKVTGALVGAALATAARRGLGPLSVAIAAGYGPKKFSEHRKAKRVSS